MNLTWLAPGWLFLLLALPLLAIVRARVQVPLHLLVRGAVVALLILGLARPAYFGRDERHRAVFVVDVSRSVSSRDPAGVVAARERLPSDAIASLIEFGAAGDRSLAAAATTRFDRVIRIAGEDSSLSAALDEALRLIPAGAPGSITLVTDSLATDRRDGDALVAIEERGIPVHTVAIDAARREPVVARIRAPHTLRAGAEGEIEIAITGDVKSARVVLSVDGRSVGTETIALAESRGLARFRYEPRAAGFCAAEARIEVTADPAFTTTLAVQPPLRALYLGERIEGAREKLSELVGPGVVFESWRPSDSVAFPSLDRYDAVVLDDMPARTLGIDAQKEIVEAVTQRGLGLFASGGEAAFGPGGYHDSELAKILPVAAQQKEEKRDPSTTLVLVIDTSGSMTGERIQLAKEVARLAMSRLLPHDKVGIVEFYGAKRWAAPIQPASNTIDLSRAINRMDAGGGTVILPAIEEAFYAMQNVQTRYKHVLVLTDGGVENGAFEPLLRRMADDGITTSTVLIGPEANSEFLVDLSNWGKGRFYSVPDRFNLPEILFKQPTSSRLPAYKPGAFAVASHGGPGFFGEIDRAAIPGVAGYADTSARPGAEVLLEIEAEHAPLLATWQFGLGRVMALTTEPVGPGTASWRDWPGYGPLLRRILERTAGDGREPYDFTLVREGAQIEVVATRRGASVGEPVARQVSEHGELQDEFRFDERADGRFVARALFPPERELRLVGGSTVNPIAAGEPVYAVSPPRADELGELAVAPVEAVDLSSVARATGGDALDEKAFAGFTPRPSRAGGERLVELAPFCLALGLLLYFFELFHRRRPFGGVA